MRGRGPNKFSYFRPISIACVILFITACGGSNNTTPPLGSEAPKSTLKQIVPLTPSENNSININLEEYNPSYQLILILYGIDSDEIHKEYQFEVRTDSEIPDFSEGTEDDKSIGNEGDSGGYIDVVGLKETDSNTNESVLCIGDNTVPAIGDSKEFYVPLRDSHPLKYTTVKAVLRYITDNFYAYIDERNAESITDEELVGVLEPFSNRINDIRAIFGSESDVNCDGHFTILMTQVLNELDPLGVYTIMAFVSDPDLGTTTNSNQAEIIYTIVPDPTGDFGRSIIKEYFLSRLSLTLPHELQHLISLNRPAYNEVLIITEGLSHLAEDIYSLENGYMENVSSNNITNVSGYLSYTNYICFFGGWPHVSAYRGGVYLFLRYLYEQAQSGNLTTVTTGNELIGNLLNSGLSGRENVANAVGGEDALRELLGNFALAVYLDDRIVDNPMYQFEGINLTGGQYEEGIWLYGPYTPGLTATRGTMRVSGIVYREVSEYSRNKYGTNINIYFEDGIKVGGYILLIDKGY